MSIKGGSVCRVHGGGSPAVKRKAKERIAEQEVRAEYAKLEALIGEPEPITDPLSELLRLAGGVKRWREFIEGRVAHLSSLGYSGPVGEQIRAEVQLLQSTTPQLAGILTSIARLNIDERLARVNQEQGEQVAAVITAVLDWLGLSDEHRRQAVGIITATIRARDSGKKPELPPPPHLYETITVEVPVPTAPPPQLERLQIEAPKPAQSVPFVVEAEPTAPNPSNQPPSAPNQPPNPFAGSYPTGSAPAASEDPNRPMTGREFWGMPPSRGRRPW